jgi:hypothetical protein
MAQTEPQFKPGDRFFTHYDMKWGTVVSENTTYRNQTHGVTGSKLPDTTWYNVKYDDGSTSLLDDAHGNWDMARIVPPYRQALRLRRRPERKVTCSLSRSTQHR